jgi:hypothetical protein
LPYTESHLPKVTFPSLLAGNPESNDYGHSLISGDSSIIHTKVCPLELWFIKGGGNVAKALGSCGSCGNASTYCWTLRSPAVASHTILSVARPLLCCYSAMATAPNDCFYLYNGKGLPHTELISLFTYLLFYLL